MQGLQGVQPFQQISQARWARPVAGVLGLLLAGTFLLSLWRVVGRYNSPKSKRRRTVDLNKVPSLPRPRPEPLVCFVSWLCTAMRERPAFRLRPSVSGLASCPLKAAYRVQMPCLHCRYILCSLRDC